TATATAATATAATATATAIRALLPRLLGPIPLAPLLFDSLALGVKLLLVFVFQRSATDREEKETFFSLFCRCCDKYKEVAGLSPPAHRVYKVHAREGRPPSTPTPSPSPSPS